MSSPLCGPGGVVMTAAGLTGSGSGGLDGGLDGGEAVLEAVAGAVDGDDFAVVQKPVNEGGEHRVAEMFRPALDADVAGGDDGAFQVAGADHLEQQGAAVLVRAAVAELVDQEAGAGRRTAAR